MVNSIVALDTLKSKGVNGKRFYNKTLEVVKILESDENLTFEKIYLFGSLASLTFNPLSDIDLLLVYHDAVSKEQLKKEVLYIRENYYGLDEETPYDLTIVWNKQLNCDTPFWYTFNSANTLIWERRI